MGNHIQPNVTIDESSTNNRNNDADEKETNESAKRKNIEAIRKRLNEFMKGFGDEYAAKLVNGGYNAESLCGATIEDFEKVFKKDPIPIPLARQIIRCFEPRKESKKMVSSLFPFA